MVDKSFSLTFSGMFRSYLHVILLRLASALAPYGFLDGLRLATVGYGSVIDLNVSKTHQDTCFGANCSLDRFEIF